MADKPSWHAAYPAPRNKQPAAISAQELLGRLQNGEKVGIDMLLIDLRRTDHEVSLFLRSRRRAEERERACVWNDG